MTIPFWPLLGGVFIGLPVLVEFFGGRGRVINMIDCGDGCLLPALLLALLCFIG